jgi:catechol 2,3-dioxygenase-like lactoylglutathione lyase family enzyme
MTKFDIKDFNSLVPELYVSDYNKSRRFYVNILGFELGYERHSPDFALLIYGQAQIMIQQQEPSDWHTGELIYPYGRGINFQISTPSIDDVVSRLQKYDYPIRRGIEESWRKVAGNILVGEQEIHVLDPDGYFLRFSEEIGIKPA